MRGRKGRRNIVKKHYSIDLTTGSIAKKLTLFALPLLASLLLQSFYNAADKAVVGQFAGKTALAAVGATGSATGMIVNLVVGLSIGASIINANLLGAGEKTALRRNMHTSILMGAICGVALSVLGLVASRPILELMGCPDNVLDSATLYMRIFFCGSPASMVYNFGSGILRTHGDSRRPMVILGVSGLANVLLNLVFVIVFKMSVAGVALATIISQYISAAWVLKILFDPKDEYQLSRQELKLNKEDAIGIIRVGIPCSLNDVLISCSNVLLQSTINGFGDVAIAGSSASDAYTHITYQIMVAFGHACVTFAGQCYGAGKYKRIDKLFLNAATVCSSIYLGAALAATFVPNMILGIFSDDQAVWEMGQQKMLVVSWSYVFSCNLHCIGACLRGMKKPSIPTTSNVICYCGLRILWIYLIFPLYPEIWFLYMCYPISHVSSFAITGAYYLYYRKKLSRKALPA